MIEDDVIRGVRAAREEYARRHGFNIRAMVADLQARDAAGDWPVVNRPAQRLASAETPNQMQPTGIATAVPQIPGSPETVPAGKP